MNTTEQVFLFGQVEDGSSYSGKQMESNEVDHEQPMAAPTLASVQDLSCVCRICATPNDYLIPIFEGEGLQNNIADKINKHLPIKVTETDSLPRQLCYHCASTVLAWVELVDCCTQSNLALRNKQDSLLKNVVQTGESNKTDKEDIDNRLVDGVQTGFQSCATRVHQSAGDYNRIMEIHKCIFCNESFQTETVFTDHLIEHHADLLFHCDVCNNYLDRKELIPHMSAHATQYELERCKNYAKGLVVEKKAGKQEDKGEVMKKNCNADTGQAFIQSETENNHIPAASVNENRNNLNQEVLSAVGEKRMEEFERSEIENNSRTEMNKKSKAETKNDSKIKVYVSSQSAVIRETRSRGDKHSKHTTGKLRTANLNEIKRDSTEDLLREISKHVDKNVEKGPTNIGREMRSHTLLDDPTITTYRVEDPFSDNDSNGGFGPLPDSVFEAIKDNDDLDTIDLKGTTTTKDTKQVKRLAKPIQRRASTRLTEKSPESRVVVLEDNKKKKAVLSKLVIEATMNNQANEDKIDCQTKTDQNTLPSTIKTGSVNENSKSKSAQKKQKKKSRSCPTCFKEFFAASSYFYHLKHVHVDIDKRNYLCDICKGMFASKSALSVHRTIHSDTMKHKCEQCGKKFRSHASIYIHLKNVHNASKKFTCNQCDRSFIWKQKLIRHLRTHSAVKTYFCSECNRGFHVRCDLARHVKTHSSVKPFPCPECTSAFAQKRYLKVHLRKMHPTNL